MAKNNKRLPYDHGMVSWKGKGNKFTLDMGDGVSYEIYRDPYASGMAYQIELNVATKLKSGGTGKKTLYLKPERNLSDAKRRVRQHWESRQGKKRTNHERPMGRRARGKF